MVYPSPASPTITTYANLCVAGRGDGLALDVRANRVFKAPRTISSRPCHALLMLMTSWEPPSLAGRPHELIWSLVTERGMPRHGHCSWRGSSGSRPCHACLRGDQCSDRSSRRLSSRQEHGLTDQSDGQAIVEGSLDVVQAFGRPVWSQKESHAIQRGPGEVIDACLRSQGCCHAYNAWVGDLKHARREQRCAKRRREVKTSSNLLCSPRLSV